MLRHFGEELLVLLVGHDNLKNDLEGVSESNRKRRIAKICTSSSNFIASAETDFTFVNATNVRIKPPSSASKIDLMKYEFML